MARISRSRLLWGMAVFMASLLVHVGLASAADYKTQVLADHPGNFWMLNETSGYSAADLSGSGDAGTYATDAALGESAPAPTDPGSGSVGFTSSSTTVGFTAPVSGADATTASGLSVEMWIRAPAQGYPSFSMTLPGEFSFSFSTGSTLGGEWDPSVSIYDGTHTDSAGGEALAFGNTWHLVDFTWKASNCTVTLYVNGAESQNYSPFFCQGGPGTDTYGEPLTFTAWPGQVADLSIFPGTLTATQIQAHYNSAHNAATVVPPSTFNGSGNPSNPNLPKADHGEPVNDATGNFTATRSDLTIQGAGGPLSFSRTYNAQVAAASGATEGLLGYGWSTSYSDHLSINTSAETATVTSSDGSTAQFSSSASGSFTPTAWNLATLVQNTNGTYSYTLPNQTVETFSAAGLLTSETDAQGNTTSLSYANGQLSTITAPSGRQLSLAYNSGGQIASVSDPLGNTVSYTYDSAGDLTQVTDPGNRVWQYTYDSDHRLLTIEDPRTNTVLTNTYNSSNQITEQQDALGNTTKWSYTQLDANDSETAITLPNSSLTQEYFTNNLPTETITDAGTALAASTYATYDSAGDALTSVDGNGHTTTYTYDSRGNRLTETSPLGEETKWTYNAANDLTSVTLPSGAETTYGYNSNNTLASQSQQLDESTELTTSYAYTDSAYPSLVTSVTDPRLKTTSYGYNEQGDRTSVTDAMGNETTYGYDADGQRTSVTSPKGNLPNADAANFTTSTTLNAAGQPLTITDPLGHETGNTYDADGNLATTTDARNNETTYTYDANNQRTQTTRPDSSVEKTSYNAMGNVATQTNAANAATTYSYNSQDQLSSVETPSGKTTSYLYDADGNAVTITEPTSDVVTKTYNADDELTGMSYSDGTTHAVSYTYTPDGLRHTMADATGTTTWGYDGADRLTSVQDGAGNNVGYKLDADGNPTTITYPGSDQVTQTFNADDQLSAVEDWLGNTTTFGYDPNSNQTTISFPDSAGTVDTTTYDDADEISGITSTQGTATIASEAYTLNADGQITNETDTGLPGPSSNSYTYNSLGQLTGDSSGSYAYDSADDPTEIAGVSGSAFNSDGELTSTPAATGSSTSTSYGYDANGDRTNTTPAAGAAIAYTYDGAGNLTGVTRAAAGSVPAISDTYAYDGDGLRQSETIGGTSTLLTWDQSGSLPLLIKDGSTSTIYGPNDLPIEQIDGSGNVLYYHHDQQGSTRALTDQSGDVVATFTYGPYGSMIASTGSVVPAFGYDGQLTDQDTGLIYLRARVYDPSTAQFLTRDPLDAASGQAYAYAGDNPVMSSDPTGLLCALNYCTRFDPMAGLDALVNIGRGATFGFTNTIDNWISSGSACTVPEDETDQELGQAGAFLASGGLIEAASGAEVEPELQSSFIEASGNAAGNLPMADYITGIARAINDSGGLDAMSAGARVMVENYIDTVLDIDGYTAANVQKIAQIMVQSRNEAMAAARAGWR